LAPVEPSRHRECFLRSTQGRYLIFRTVHPFRNLVFFGQVVSGLFDVNTLKVRSLYSFSCGVEVEALPLAYSAASELSEVI
jgi:hypothetical protein